MPPAHRTAADASLQAFVNCYLREVDPGRWLTVSDFDGRDGVAFVEGETHVVVLDLPSLGKRLAVGVRYRSLVGRHCLTTAYERFTGSQAWRRLDPLSTQLLLTDAIYGEQRESKQRLELIGRVIESHQVMAQYLEGYRGDHGDCGRGTCDTFIASEQSVVFGHWLHPTPKSRHGIHRWQHELYAPELRGRFQLHFFAARRELVRQASIASTSAEAISREIATQGADAASVDDLLRALGSDYCLLPLHPLQAQWLLHQGYVGELLASRQIVDLGALGPAFTATSSVRTVYCETVDYMLKLSIPVKITNSLRVNLESELGDSVWISKLMRACRLTESFPQFRPIEDPAYINVAVPGWEETEAKETGFEVIFRSNPFTVGAGRGLRGEVHSVAALVQDPLPGSTRSELSRLVHLLAEREALSLPRAAFRWFEVYLETCVTPAIQIYDQHGIALEAHQQNALVGFSEAGLPERFYYRDIQGLALSETFRAEALEKVPELARQHKVFESDEIVRNGIGYYLFFNHLYAVIHRFGVDGLADESALLEVLYHRLTQLRPTMRTLGGRFIDTLLEQPYIPCKANLLTRIEDLDELQCENELAVYGMVANPLVALHRGAVGSSVARDVDSKASAVEV